MGGGLYGIISGLTKSTDHPSEGIGNTNLGPIPSSLQPEASGRVAWRPGFGPMFGGNRAWA